MKNRISKFVALVAFAGTAAISQGAWAAEFCSDVKVVEVSAGHNGSPAEYDLAVQVHSTSGSIFFDHKWTYARHANFGHTGVQRIERLATAALLSGRTMYWCYEETTSDVSRVYLK